MGAAALAQAVPDRPMGPIMALLKTYKDLVTVTINRYIRRKNPERGDMSCFLWKAAKTVNLYPLLRILDKWKFGLNLRRVIYTAFYGREPVAGEAVYSTCATKGCANPRHMMLYKEHQAKRIVAWKKAGLIRVENGILIVTPEMKAMFDKKVHVDHAKESLVSSILKHFRRKAKRATAPQDTAPIQTPPEGPPDLLLDTEDYLHLEGCLCLNTNHVFEGPVPAPAGRGQHIMSIRCAMPSHKPSEGYGEEFTIKLRGFNADMKRMHPSTTSFIFFYACVNCIAKRRKELGWIMGDDFPEHSDGIFVMSGVGAKPSWKNAFPFLSVVSLSRSGALDDLKRELGAGI